MSAVPETAEPQLAHQPDDIFSEVSQQLTCIHYLYSDLDAAWETTPEGGGLEVLPQRCTLQPKHGP